MRMFLAGSLLLAAVMGACAASEQVVVLSPAGDVADDLVARVQAVMEENLGVVVRVGPAVAFEPGASLEAIGRAAAEQRAEDAFAVLVLARPDSEQPQGVCLPHESFGILNLNRLADDDPNGKFERRIGQDAQRIMAMLVDMPPCPFPLCLLVGYEKTDDLDHMSGNFCPPCQDRFRRLAGEAGLRMAPAVEAAEAAAEAVEAVEPADAN
ncbi:MAG TPA: hypothetical protein P5169_07955 [Kiritimatiellia bacterium]|jgi:hypothetical protein|nr:hypothetical protein [Lentisphaerota bacterium]HRV31632.1 hypothetical protein [Kiritimatiellia bacterium]